MVNIKKILRSLSLNVILLILLIYFVFHTIYGNLGVISYFKLNQQLEKTQNRLNELVITRVELESQTELLKSGDRDFIDEKARDILGVATKEEQVFTRTKKQSSGNDDR